MSSFLSLSSSSAAALWVPFLALDLSWRILSSCRVSSSTLATAITSSFSFSVNSAFTLSSSVSTKQTQKHVISPTAKNSHKFIMFLIFKRANRMKVVFSIHNDLVTCKTQETWTQTKDLKGSKERISYNEKI